MFRKDVKIVLAGILASMVIVTGCGDSGTSGLSAASTDYGTQSEDISVVQESADAAQTGDAGSGGRA